MRLLGIASAAVLLTGCGQSAQQSLKYQISIAPSDQVYRLDSTTGEVTLIEKAATQGPAKLVVGSFYETEHGDIKTRIYAAHAGGHRFETGRSHFESVIQPGASAGLFVWVRAGCGIPFQLSEIAV